MAHFAKYMMFKTLVASRRYASESSNNGVETFLSSHSRPVTHYSCFENMGLFVTLKKIRSKIWT